MNQNQSSESQKGQRPILQLNRLTYAKISCRILESTNEKLERYIAYASAGMNTEITAGDVIEHGLKLLFERDAGFRESLKSGPQK